MNITPEEAQAALDDIQHATTKIQEICKVWAYYPLLWGGVWTIGFLMTQLKPQLINWIWIVMIIIGIVGSALIGITQGRHMRITPGTHAAFINSRLGIFYGVLYGFAVLWLIIFPLTPLQVGMLWVTVVMFGFIIAGAWLGEPWLIGLGVGITMMSVLGYYLLPNYFWLWEAVFAGLPQIGVGIYQLRQQ